MKRDERSAINVSNARRYSRRSVTGHFIPESIPEQFCIHRISDEKLMWRINGPMAEALR